MVRTPRTPLAYRPSVMKPSRFGTLRPCFCASSTASGFMPSTDMSSTSGAWAGSFAAPACEQKNRNTQDSRQYFIGHPKLKTTKQLQKLLGRLVHVALPIVGCGRVRTVGDIFRTGKSCIFVPAHLGQR